MAAEVRDFDPGVRLGRKWAWRADSCAQLALVAADEAVADAGLILRADGVTGCTERTQRRVK
jgi:hypothetical protein